MRVAGGDYGARPATGTQSRELEDRLVTNRRDTRQQAAGAEGGRPGRGNRKADQVTDRWGNRPPEPKAAGPAAGTGRQTRRETDGCGAAGWAERGGGAVE